MTVPTIVPVWAAAVPAAAAIAIASAKTPAISVVAPRRTDLHPVDLLRHRMGASLSSQR
jgi:hypothetical protein